MREKGRVRVRVRGDAGEKEGGSGRRGGRMERVRVRGEAGGRER